MTRTLTIIRMYWTEDNVHEGSIDMDTVIERSDVYENLTARETADRINALGLTFYSTGTTWAGNPDGSQITDYATGERCETTAHLDGYPARVGNAIMDVVG